MSGALRVQRFWRCKRSTITVQNTNKWAQIMRHVVNTNRKCGIRTRGGKRK